MRTPLIPQWIRDISHPQYRNIYSYNLGQKNLWGTETLFGDWDGKKLLIAQDFYPSSWIESRLNLPTPYAHNPAAPTNRNLIKTLRHFRALREEAAANDSDLLYISACFLLRADGVTRGPLPDIRKALAISAPVVSFTISHMKNLESIILMGRKAEEAFRQGGAMDQSRSTIKTFTVSHPARAMSDPERFAEWQPIFS